ncbi:MAG: AAA family ATPase [Cyanobacteriota/Melainabacteria group bacterium]
MRYPGLHRFKMEVLRWRFYESFRTDKESPLRQPQPGVFSGALDATGSNLAATIASIVTADDAGDFENALDEAFPGTTLSIKASRQGLKLAVTYPGMARSLEAPELSDGTLQYIALLTALHALDPPPLLAINEPETSIHDDLMEPLAKAIVRASENSQIWVTTHSKLLSDYILDYGGYDELTLEKTDGETRVVGLGIDGRIIEDQDDEEDEEDEDLNL